MGDMTDAERKWDIGSRVRISSQDQRGTICELADGLACVCWDDGMVSEPMMHHDVNRILANGLMWMLLPPDSHDAAAAQPSVVKAGDRFEAVKTWAFGCPVGHVLVVSNVDHILGLLAIKCTVNGCAGSACFNMPGYDLYLRRLPPEPEPLCECGAPAGDYKRCMEPCYCMVVVCVACEGDRRGSVDRHRALKHPETIVSSATHVDVSPTPKPRPSLPRPVYACVCLRRVCPTCGSKLAREEEVARLTDAFATPTRFTADTWARDYGKKGS